MIEAVLRKEVDWLARSLGHKAHPRTMDATTIQIRVMGYQPRLGLDYQCPACWMQSEVRSSLDPIPTRTKDDALACDVCGCEYLITR